MRLPSWAVSLTQGTAYVMFSRVSVLRGPPCSAYMCVGGRGGKLWDWVGWRSEVIQILSSCDRASSTFLDFILSPGDEFNKWKVKVKVPQSCLTLCDPTEYTVHGIVQARILEWVAFPFSSGSSQARD